MLLELDIGTEEGGGEEELLLLWLEAFVCGSKIDVKF
jgi:hypothetical protein